MNTQQKTLLAFLGQPQTQFTVPPFQRVYSWEAKECADFWDDIMKAGAAGHNHFMGVVLYTRSSAGWKSIEQLNVVDGQQRLTTFTVMLTALHRYCTEHGLTVDDMGPDDIAARFLLADVDGELQSKLVLTYLDRFTLFELVIGADPSEEHAERIGENFQFFYDRMNREGFDLAAFWRGVTQLFVLEVELEGRDRPQIVFESLNSKGMSLTTADLLRSRILPVDKENPGQNLYETYWLPVVDIAQRTLGSRDEASKIAEAFVARKCRERALIHDEAEIYPFFKELLRDDYGNDLPHLLVDLQEFAELFDVEEGFRTEQLKNRAEWVKGRAKGAISKYKLFGD
ncbi:MAG: DUF262 domain-containing protein [Coriobacteriia bacterium]|nr:DUF262 domain-containing protein [Coriobacteriia bacterium]